MKRYQSIIAVFAIFLAFGTGWGTAWAGTPGYDECEIEGEGDWQCEYFPCYEHCFCVGDYAPDEYFYFDSGTLCGDFQDYGVCDRPDTCDGFGECVGNVEPDTTRCHTGFDSDCDPDIYCSGNSAYECLVDLAQYYGDPCGDPSSDLALCDQADICDGNGFCDPNPLPAGTVCRYSVDDECDFDEYCNGVTGDDCPADSVEPAGTPCGDSYDYGLCDDPDTCDGSGYCDMNIEPSTTICRYGIHFQCDPDEYCTGFTGDDCPPDFKEEVGTACRDSTEYGGCDHPDTCDETGWCNFNVEPPGTVCREKDDLECDVEEVCSGITGDDCPPDAFEPEFTACGNDSDTACTEPDSCDGEGTCLPRNEPCALVTSSSLCTFDVQPDKGICTEIDPEEGHRACLVDPVCEANGGTTCADGVCLDADGNELPGPVICTDDCEEDNDYCEQSSQFRLVFTPDVKNFPAFKLPASNPGQTFYNAIVQGTPGYVQVDFEIPWPYETVGAWPVKVHDGYDAVGACIDTNGDSTGESCVVDGDCGSGETCDTSCFAPGDPIQQFDVRWAIQDYFEKPEQHPDVDCDNVCGPDGPGACRFSLDVLIPASGEAYVNVHLDYGLKGPHTDANPCDDSLADRYDKGDSSGDKFAVMGWDALENNDTEDGPVAIANCSNYEFMHYDGALSYTDAVQNLNEFKPIAGAFGHSGDQQTGASYGGLTLALAKASDPSGILTTTTTDEDGYYTLPYKHKGKPAIYTLSLYDETGTNLLGSLDFELQGNGWSQINFDSSGDPCDADSAFCECNGWCAAAEYGSGRQSGGSDGGSSGGSCELAQTGDSCTDNSDCCSNSCKGKAGQKVCK